MLNLPGASIQKLMNVSDSVFVTDSTSEVRAVLVMPRPCMHTLITALPLFPTGAGRVGGRYCWIDAEDLCVLRRCVVG